MIVGDADPGGLRAPFSSGSDAPHGRPSYVEGPSYPRTLKILAVLAVSVTFLAMVLAWDGAAWRRMGWGERGFLFSVIAVVLYGLATIVRSRTFVDGRVIEQRGPLTKTIVLADITQLKFIHLRGWEWLVVPRLIVRRGAVGLTTIPAADPEVIAAFRALAYGESDGKESTSR